MIGQNYKNGYASQRSAAFYLLIALLPACSGGGGDGPGTEEPPPEPPPEPPGNLAPVVDAGPDQEILLGKGTALAGSASDDGLPEPGTLTIAWSQVSGAGTATFADATRVDSGVSFDEAGSYVLRLSADDGDLTGSDDVAIAVTADEPPPGGVLGFTDITATAGVGGPDYFGGHGVQIADVTGDGFADVYVTVNQVTFGDVAELFFRNLDGESFAEEAAARGIDNFDSGSHGGVFADFDNDGDFDLFNGSYERNRLYRNDGSGAFTDRTRFAGLPDRQWPTRGVVAIDMDLDGNLDIVAINGFRGTDDPASERNEIYRNVGGFSFETADLEPVFSAPAGQGITDVDYDNDGYPDLLAANRTGDVVILRNVSGSGFEIVAPGNIGIEHGAGDGISFADVDADGWLDALLDDRLYLADGNGAFRFARRLEGPGAPAPYMGGFADLDNDGDPDLVFPGANFVYFNDGAGRFDPGETFALGSVDDPRSVAFADFDNDGDLDFLYAQKHAANRLIRNDYAGGNAWLRVRLERANGQAGAYGTRVYAYPAGRLGSSGELITWREAHSQHGYLAQDDPRLHLGLGDRDRVDLRVLFPGGGTVDMPGVGTRQTIELRE